MSTCYAKAPELVGQQSEHLCTFLYVEAVLTEIAQFGVVGWDGWCINNECGFGLLETLRNGVNIVLVVNLCAFLDKLFGEVGWCTVVSSDIISFLQEIAQDGTHADATGSYKIY